MNQTKVFYTASVEAALSQAKKEFGPDVMLVNSRQTGPDHRHLGAYEVLFSVEGEGEMISRPAPAADRVWDEVNQIRRLADRIYYVLTSRPDSTQSAGSPWTDWEVQLRQQGFEPDTVQHLLRNIAAELRETPQPVPAALERILAKTVRCRDGWLPAADHNTLILVGPPGVGKTLLAAKLAARLGLDQKKKVVIASLDGERVGGTSQLQELCTILGLPFRALESVGALVDFATRHANKNAVIIDTPGFGGREEALAHAFASDLQRLSLSAETHLVLPATMRDRDLQGVAQRFRPFKPDYLCFSRLDEAVGWGAIWNEAERWQLPLSFLSHGQSVPEDILLADSSRLARFVMSGASR